MAPKWLDYMGYALRMQSLLYLYIRITVIHTTTDFQNVHSVVCVWFVSSNSDTTITPCQPPTLVSSKLTDKQTFRTFSFHHVLLAGMTVIKVSMSQLHPKHSGSWHGRCTTALIFFSEIMFQQLLTL